MSTFNFWYAIHIVAKFLLIVGATAVYALLVWLAWLLWSKAESDPAGLFQHVVFFTGLFPWLSVVGSAIYSSGARPLLTTLLVMATIIFHFCVAVASAHAPPEIYWAFQFAEMCLFLGVASTWKLWRRQSPGAAGGMNGQAG